MAILSENKMTITYQSPDLDHLSQYFINVFPFMDINEQRLALGLYVLIARGQPVAIEVLSGRIGMAVEETKAILDSWLGVFFDDKNRVIGFWGITISEMSHRFEVNRKTVYTWCAWDALFIPELLNATANVTSHCATTGEEIKLIISPDEINASSSEDVMVSFLIPNENELNENIMASFCHYVHFFTSCEAGEQWIVNHKDTFLLSLKDAFTVGKKMNAIRYRQMFATKRYVHH